MSLNWLKSPSSDGKQKKSVSISLVDFSRKKLTPPSLDGGILIYFMHKLLRTLKILLKLLFTSCSACPKSMMKNGKYIPKGYHFE